METQDRTRWVCFGPFEVDLRSGELYRDGKKIRLQEQPFQLLTVLLHRPGELVTRDELRCQVWPAGTYLEFDHALNTAIKKIRAALEDDALAPQYIETIPKRGYRLIAPVEVVQARTRTAPAPAPVPWRTRFASFAVGAISALLLSSFSKPVDPARQFAGPRVAVLAVENEGENPGAELLCARLTQELFLHLGEAGVVVSPGTPGDVTEPLKASEISSSRLNYFLTSRVRNDAGHVQVSVELVRARGRVRIWEKSFGHDLADPQVVVQDLAGAISADVRRALAVEGMTGAVQ